MNWLAGARLRIMDGLAISCGVAVVLLFAYVCEIEIQIFGMVYADLDADDFIFTTFALSVLVAIISSGHYVRPALDPDEDF